MCCQLWLWARAACFSWMYFTLYLSWCLSSRRAFLLSISGWHGVKRSELKYFLNCRLECWVKWVTAVSVLSFTLFNLKLYIVYITLWSTPLSPLNVIDVTQKTRILAHVFWSCYKLHTFWKDIFHLYSVIYAKQIFPEYNSAVPGCSQACSSISHKNQSALMLQLVAWL